MNQPPTPRPGMRVAAVGVHVLDTHVIGIESIPSGSDGALVDTIRLSPAGTAGGAALVLSRLGADVLSFGAVGTDPSGELLRTLLEREGVDVSGLVGKDDAQTSGSVIPVRPNGDRPAWHCIGANGAFTLEDLDREALVGITHLHLGGPEFLGGEAAAELLALARSLGATTSMDILAPGDPDMLAWIAAALPETDYLLPNDEQVLGFTGTESLVEGAQTLVAAGAGCVAVTRGARGALVVDGVGVTEVPALVIDPEDLIDTTGCGDAFSAGFLRGLSLGHPPVEAAALGCATAAQVARGLGTDAGAYDLEWVLRSVRSVN